MNVSATEAAVRAGKPAAAESNPELHQLVCALQAVREGDFSVRLPADWTGLFGKAADLFNDIVACNARLSAELIRVEDAVGKQGQTRQRMRGYSRAGAWGAPPRWSTRRPGWWRHRERSARRRWWPRCPPPSRRRGRGRCGRTPAIA